MEPSRHGVWDTLVRTARQRSLCMCAFLMGAPRTLPPAVHSSVGAVKVRVACVCPPWAATAVAALEKPGIGQGAAVQHGWPVMAHHATGLHG